MNIFQKYISKFHVYTESSLSRILGYMDDHETGMITAYRKQYTHEQNQKRNRSLHALLSLMGYRITDVKGSYIENYNSKDATEIGEHVYFVTDWQNKRDLKRHLCELGEKFDQDSILFIPQGGATSILIGTNRAARYPGYQREIELPVRKIGTDNYKFLTRVNGRPFYFKEQILDESYCGDNYGLWAASTIADKPWEQIEKD